MSELTETCDFPAMSEAQFPGFSCAYRTVTTMITKLDGCCALLLESSICEYNSEFSLNLRSSRQQKANKNLFHLFLSQEDMIFGFKAKIQESILEIEKDYSPDAIYVITTCVSEITGEDVNEALEEIRSRNGARLILIHGDNFSCRDNKAGIEQFFLAFAEMMKPACLHRNSVNLLGFYASSFKHCELIRLLERKGVSLSSVISSENCIKTLSNAPAARLNIVLDCFALPLAKEMKDRFGTEYFYCERPYTPKAIEKMYQDIGDFLGIDLLSESSSMKEEAEAAILNARNIFAGATFAVARQMGNNLDLLKLLTYLNIDVKVLILNKLIQGDRNSIKELLSMGVDPFVTCCGNKLQIESLLSKIKPQYYIGGREHVVLADLDIERRNSLYSSNCFGFDLIEDVIDSLQKRPRGQDTLMYKSRILREVQT
ncbi:nitrogenase component 1 [uncultured Methanolobus sp.]|uniref:nitrogenase component 1 n=1 Tax=uncultured Methanolobus sp. TaxID=218300 RepID=UPI0037487227